MDVLNWICGTFDDNSCRLVVECTRARTYGSVSSVCVTRVKSVKFWRNPFTWKRYTTDSTYTATAAAATDNSIMEVMDSDPNTVLHSVTKGVNVGPPSVVTWPGMENVTNASVFDESNLPYDMKFNEGHVVAIITYSILMVVSAIGNITVLTIILKRRRKAGTRIHAMLMHLAIADLLVREILQYIIGYPRFFYYLYTYNIFYDKSNILNPALLRSLFTC